MDTILVHAAEWGASGGGAIYVCVCVCLCTVFDVVEWFRIFYANAVFVFSCVFMVRSYVTKMTVYETNAKYRESSRRNRTDNRLFPIHFSEISLVAQYATLWCGRNVQVLLQRFLLTKPMCENQNEFSLTFCNTNKQHIPSKVSISHSKSWRCVSYENGTIWRVSSEDTHTKKKEKKNK